MALRRWWFLSVVVAVAMSAPDVGAAAGRCWVPPVAAEVADPFRAPACAWCPGNRGIEYVTEPGEAVRAVAAGEVVFSGKVVGTDYVVVEHGDGLRATYGGLRRRMVDRGETIIAGSIVGRAGSSLHFGLRDGADYLDPAPYLGRLAYRARLVPTVGSIPPSRQAPSLRCQP